MDIKFIPAIYKEEVHLPEDCIQQLPQKIALFGSIQFHDQLERIQKELQEKGKDVILPESKNYYYQGKQSMKGQLLGCNLENIPGVDAFLYIGDGMFHPKILAVKNPQPIMVYNPLSKLTETINVEDIQKMKQKRMAAYKTFLSSTDIGVMVSTKPGQNYLKPALKLKEKFPEKTFYFIVFNTVDFNELENFPFVQMWINTACYRIGYDDILKVNKPMMNYSDLMQDLEATNQ